MLEFLHLVWPNIPIDFEWQIESLKISMMCWTENYNRVTDEYKTLIACEATWESNREIDIRFLQLYL